MSKTAKRPGRPPKAEQDKFGSVTVRLPKETIREIDDRVRRRGDPDRSTTIRDLLARALAA